VPSDFCKVLYIKQINFTEKTGTMDFVVPGDETCR